MKRITVKKTLLEKYREPVPAKWRKIGDTALLLCLAIEPAVSSMPLQNQLAKEWIVWLFSAFLILFKFWTNTKSIHE